jgi:hypothetical protein
MPQATATQPSWSCEKLRSLGSRQDKRRDLPRMRKYTGNHSSSVALSKSNKNSSIAQTPSCRIISMSALLSVRASFCTHSTHLSTTAPLLKAYHHATILCICTVRVYEKRHVVKISPLFAAAPSPDLARRTLWTDRTRIRLRIKSLAEWLRLLTTIVVKQPATKILCTSMSISKYFQQISDRDPSGYWLDTRPEFPAHMCPERHQAI